MILKKEVVINLFLNDKDLLLVSSSACNSGEAPQEKYTFQL